MYDDLKDKRVVVTGGASGIGLAAARRFVEENGKFNAASGCHDDRVMSAAMASQMLVLLPKRFKKLSEESSDFEGFSNIHDRYQPEKADTYYEIYVD